MERGREVRADFFLMEKSDFLGGGGDGAKILIIQKLRTRLKIVLAFHMKKKKLKFREMNSGEKSV